MYSLMMFQEGSKHVGVKYTLWHFMFLIYSAIVGKIILYLSKYTVKQQIKKCKINFRTFLHRNKLNYPTIIRFPSFQIFTRRDDMMTN
jgi:hypothetical protein